MPLNLHSPPLHLRPPLSCFELNSPQFDSLLNSLDQETLLGLLGMAGRRPSLPMIVCCSTRDELDTICSNLSSLSTYVSVSPLYSDLSEVERAEVLDRFRQATMRWNSLGRGEEAVGEGDEERKSHVVVVTDACLPLLGSVEAPLCACMLINYELPTKKETYMRRMTACLSADGIVISMVVGGEVVILKNLEESSCLVIAEMPINSGPEIQVSND
ncbi:ATP-dependent RNA helicase eIF4A isoform X2 [Salvia splendens]|uniref:ATP-dependent RNA helicase eIF4A isoform X2 n=2 Tax=Salvia splendens TaxID=180675 RepID=UPI001C25B395|nr:ATP-dependent RNA helicase eIF4A isoform X2 [Salvia splendens]